MIIGYSRSENSSGFPRECTRIFVDDHKGTLLQKFFSEISAGDVIYISSINDIATSTRTFLEFIENIEKKKAYLVAHEEDIDTRTERGVFLVGVLSKLQQLDLDKASQDKKKRQEGISTVLRSGRPYGRPACKVTEEFKQVYMQWKTGKISSEEAITRAKVGKTTFYKLIKKMEDENLTIIKSNEELSKLRTTIREGIHSLELEGLTLTQHEMEMWEKIMSGELPIEAAKEDLRQFDQYMRKNHPDFYEKGE